MPRPLPPPLTLQADAYTPTCADRDAAKLDKRGRARLADALGLPDLSEEHAELIEHVLAVYCRQKHGNPDTTVGGTLAAINELVQAIEWAIKTRHPRARAKAQKLMDRTRDNRSGLAYEARVRLLSCGEIPESVLAEARAIAAYYMTHPRAESGTEPFRHFCGILRCIFDNIATPEAKDARHSLRLRRSFALAVFDVAKIETPNFVAHPERLDGLLAADVPPLPASLAFGGSMTGEFVPSMERFRRQDRT